MIISAPRTSFTMIGNDMVLGKIMLDDVKTSMG